MRRRVHYYLQRNLRWSSLHFTLLDPEKQTPERAAELAHAAQEGGSHAVMVGGSTGFTRDQLDATVKAVKSKVSIPVILFPGNGENGLSPEADAVFFMSMLNSRNPRYLIEEQAKAADEIRTMGLEAIPMGYLVVEPGGKVGQVGEARLLSRDNPQEAVRYALAAQYFGMDYVYLEAGSGAGAPVPADMITAVHRKIDIPLIVGGGIRSAATAKELIEAGADILVTGNLIEGPIDVQKTIGEIVGKAIQDLKKKIREAV
jgi:phosphoglycerol geranylgeranyltransferase